MTIKAKYVKKLELHKYKIIAGIPWMIERFEKVIVEIAPRLQNELRAEKQK